jgi:hypothetical protein
MMSSPLRLKDLAISETGFVFDPFSGGTFSLNPTGQFIVKALREGLSQDEVVARLRDQFDGVTNKLEEDVQDFVRTLSEYGLLETE